MRSSPAAWPLGLLLCLVLLYENPWFWGETWLLAGIPINLAYHIGVCVLTTLAMLVVVRWGWPKQLDEVDDE